MRASVRILALVLCALSLVPAQALSAGVVPGPLVPAYCLVVQPSDFTCSITGSVTSRFHFTVVPPGARWTVFACSNQFLCTFAEVSGARLNGVVVAPGMCPCSATLILVGTPNQATPLPVGIGVLTALPI